MAKKLKSVPYDVVSYIQIETEAIQDANDKQMISSYCLNKLSTVNWYIKILDSGSDKYIVPHSRHELASLKSQLESCHSRIMNVSVSNNKRPFLDIKYPSGYDG